MTKPADLEIGDTAGLETCATFMGLRPASCIVKRFDSLYSDWMKKAAQDKPVERLFPFVLRSRNLIVGRDTLWRSRNKLHFVLITTDLSENSRKEILSDFSYYPVVQHYTSEDLEKYFGVKGAKVVGFEKSGLAQSIYAGLKQYRLNRPVPSPNSSSAAENPSRSVPSGDGSEKDIGF